MSSLGLVSQEDNEGYSVSTYITRKKIHLHKYFINEIQNILSEYHFLVIQI